MRQHLYKSSQTLRSGYMSTPCTSLLAVWTVIVHLCLDTMRSHSCQHYLELIYHHIQCHSKLQDILKSFLSSFFLYFFVCFQLDNVRSKYQNNLSALISEVFI